ncbi:MAG: uracil-DNA glycosylase family protein [Prevotella sp.]|nr:uracil-DNA glycosylase family protein [Prevotella sp.]
MTESHPWPPFLPEHCRMLMLGSFPPSRKRWSMDFFYPNFTNDMWRIVGLCFFNDKNYFVDLGHKTFRLESLIPFLKEKGIGLFDTAKVVQRLKNTAADKDLEVIEPTDLQALLRQIPECTTVVTTGEKATDVFCQQLHIDSRPAVGSYVEFPFEERQLRLYRMPSTSRAYPLSVERKAEAYRMLFEEK